jgi:hypothetical protein
MFSPDNGKKDRSQASYWFHEVGPGKETQAGLSTPV